MLFLDGWDVEFGRVDMLGNNPLPTPQPALIPPPAPPPPALVLEVFMKTSIRPGGGTMP